MHMEHGLGEHLVSGARAGFCARFLCTSPSAHTLMKCFEIWSLHCKYMNNFKHSLSPALVKVVKGHSVQVYSTGGAETSSVNADNLLNP